MGEEAGRTRRRAKVRRFTAKRREQFLGHLRRTGNVTASAKAIGLDRSNVEKRRKRDAEFEIGCAAAEAEAAGRLAGARDPFDGVADAEFETIKRGRGGRPQIVATRKGKWCKSAETMFLDALRGCGNVAAAARAVGFSESLIWTRRREWPGFREKMEAALEEAETVLEFRLATLGNNVGIGGEEGGGLDPGLRRDDGERAQADGIPFDPDLAIRFLKWREQKRRGGGRQGREWQRPRTLAEVHDSILRKVEAISRHHNARKLAEGWSQDEEGRMIPPGWVRAPD